jgi:hypothetical protein
MAAPAHTGGRVYLKTDAERYLPRRTVKVRLVNPTDRRFEFENPWRIKNTSTDELVATQAFEPSQTFVPARGSVTWLWSQQRGYCATDCTYPGTDNGLGSYVEPGRYVAIVRTESGTFRKVFEIGRYFTIAFDREVTDETFVLFTRERKSIKQLKNDLERPEAERRIVSGIVRGGRVPYNDPWTYTMATGSIVLGDVFTEVCDATPQYVENHKRQWVGERWCPWASFVEHIGR